MYIQPMGLTGILAYALWIPAALFLGYFELHTDDAGVEVFCLLLITFLLGTLHPRHAWQWALLVGPAIPAAELLFGHPPSPPALLLAVVVAVGLAGSYAGALLRKAIS
jgi:hypothetical protein